MNEYGRYDSAIFRYLVAEDSACEILGNYITKVHHGYGFDFLLINFRSETEKPRLVRVCFLARKFFDSLSDGHFEIDSRVIGSKKDLEKAIAELKEHNNDKSRLHRSGDGIMELDDLSD